MRISMTVAVTIMAVAGLLGATGTAATAFMGVICHTPKGHFCTFSCRECPSRVCGPVCNIPKTKKHLH
jgi:hypothetical protein